MEKDKISTKIISDVAKSEGADPLNLPPLYNVIDTDALDAFFEFEGAGRPRGR